MNNKLETGFLAGLIFGWLFTASVTEHQGENILSGTEVYPSEQQCIIETGGYCHFERVGIYVANKDETL